jgi:hypothetical protein
VERTPRVPFAPLRDAPGIGVEIDEDALRKYAVNDVPFFE